MFKWFLIKAVNIMRLIFYFSCGVLLCVVGLISFWDLFQKSIIWRAFCQEWGVIGGEIMFIMGLVIFYLGVLSFELTYLVFEQIRDRSEYEKLVCDTSVHVSRILYYKMKKDEREAKTTDN